MMPEALRERNRQNAQHSTGPRSDEGRAAVAKNALRHGLRSSTILIPGEDVEAWETLCAELKAELQPVGIREWLCVELIAGAAWRLRRLRTLEAGLLRAQLLLAQLDQAQQDVKRYERDPLLEALGAIDPIVTDARAHRAALDQVETLEAQQREALTTLGSAVSRTITGLTLGTLSRYEAHVQRTLFKALHEWERLQALRLSAHPPENGDTRIHRLPDTLALFGKNVADGL
jgi:hypothetical protein